MLAIGELAWVWRMQDKDGEGPYWKHREKWLPRSTGRWNRHQNNRGHRPSTMGDIPIGRAQFTAERCAFRSLTQAYAWFTKQEERELAKLGLTLQLVWGKVTAIGERQILFIPERR